MKKNQFLDLIKDITDEADIDETILSQGFAKPIKDLEGLKELLASNELVKGIYQKELDSGIGKGVHAYEENFNKNKLPKLVDEAIRAKSNEGKTEDQIKLEQALAEIDKMKAKDARNELNGELMKELSSKGLSNDWVDFIIADNKENSIARLEKLNGLLSTATKSASDKAVKDKLGDFQYKAPEITEQGNGGITPEKFKKMGLQDRTKIYNENPELYRTLSGKQNNNN